MKPRTLLVLALLVGGLGAFVWFYERELPSSEERAERAKKLLPELEVEAVDTVVLETGETRVELRRAGAAPDGEADGGGTAPEPGGDEWRLTAPLAARADADAVRGVIGDLAGLEKTRTLDGVAAVDVGLDAPRHVVSLAGDTEVEVRVGSDVPASSDVIVALGEEPPFYVVPGGWLDRLAREPGEWRSKDLFGGSRDDIERLTLDAGEARILLAKRGEDFWVETPYVDRADSGTVSRLLTAITALEAESFVDDVPDPADLGLAEPEATVEVVLAGVEEPWRLALGSPAPAPGPAAEEGDGAAEDGTEEDRRYARADGQVVTIGPAVTEALDRPAGGWRSLGWATLEVFEIDRVTVDGPDGELTLERSGGDWLRDGERIEFATASDFLYGLTGVKADRATAAAPEGEPQMRFVLATDEGAEERLELWPEGAEGRPARVSGREVTLWLQDETLANALRRLDDLRAAAPLADEASEAAPEGGSGGGDGEAGDGEPAAAGGEPAAPVG